MLILLFHSTWKQLLSIHFLSAIFEEVVEISAYSTSLWCLVWFGCVVCDPSRCLASSELYLFAFILSLSRSFQSSVFSWTLQRVDATGSDSPPREIKQELDQNTSFHLCKLSSQILKLLCEFCFTLISYYSVNLEDKRVSVENKLRNTLLNNSITICGLYNSSSVRFSELINKSVDMKSKLLKIYLKYEYKYKLSLTRSFRNSSVSVSFVVFSSEFGLTGNVSCGNPASSSPETPGSY